MMMLRTIAGAGAGVSTCPTRRGRLGLCGSWKALVPVLFLATVCAGADNPATSARIGTPTGSFFALLVPSADESARWYREKLGFQFVRKGTGPDGASHTIMLENNGVLLEIIEHRDSFALAQVTDKREDLLRGIRKVGLVLAGADFDRVFRALTAQKVQFLGGIFEDEDLHVRSFLVRDNSGNLVQFFTDLKPPAARMKSPK
jgi:catechol 2,3-dioxygenase-like lactoylglutathione lyase family enzyme